MKLAIRWTDPETSERRVQRYFSTRKVGTFVDGLMYHGIYDITIEKED